MTANRLRWGALAWLLTLQFFVAETVVAVQQERYSWADDVISALGASTSPGARWMNASFVLQGALILAGVLALRPLLRATPGRAAVLLLGAASLGSLLVGVFPLDRDEVAHQLGAGLYFVGSTLGLIAVAYALRRRSEVVGTVLALLGLVGAAATVFFFSGVTSYLGTGGTERVAAYVLPLGLALAGATLWRLGIDPAEAGRPERQREHVRAERRRERDQRAEQDRERDAALEAAARRTDGRTAIRVAGEHEGVQPGDGDGSMDAVGDADDPEDHWSTPVRRGD